MIVRWRFDDFVDPDSGANKIAQWLIGNPQKHARLMQRLFHLGTIPYERWAKTYYFRLLTKTKSYREAGLGEIRFECDGWEQRPVGRLGISPQQYVLLMGCCKKGRERPENYRPFPPHPFDTALERSLVYLKNPNSVEERKATL